MNNNNDNDNNNSNNDKHQNGKYYNKCTRNRQTSSCCQMMMKLKHRKGYRFQVKIQTGSQLETIQIKFEFKQKTISQ